MMTKNLLTLLLFLIASVGTINAQSGCTDTLASNYNPIAQQDDGSCVYDYEGCMDPSAFNYNPNATIDDSSCYYGNNNPVVYGCTDPSAFNYNSEATHDNGTCHNDSGLVISTEGCADPLASNYDPAANISDSSCVYALDSFYVSPNNSGTFGTSIYFNCGFDLSQPLDFAEVQNTFIDGNVLAAVWFLEQGNYAVTMMSYYDITGVTEVGNYLLTMTVSCGTPPWARTSAEPEFRTVADEVVINPVISSTSWEMSEVEVLIFPNPAANQVSVITDDLESVEVIDQNGRLLASSSTDRVDISNLPEGTYIVKVEAAGNTLFSSIVKQ